MAGRRKRKVWSAEEKRLICEQARRPGVSVSRVARRYDVNANLVFKWLRDRRFAPDDAAEGEARFLPVELVRESGGGQRSAACGENRVEIDLANGHKLRVVGAWDPEALARLIRGLAS